MILDFSLFFSPKEICPKRKMPVYRQSVANLTSEPNKKFIGRNAVILTAHVAESGVNGFDLLE
jgi:hypothetical protein